MKKNFGSTAANYASGWKTAFLRFIEPDRKPAAESRWIELDETTYSICREIAVTRQSSLREAAAYMARLYEEERVSQSRLRATDEQLARNPLLALDSMISHSVVKGGAHEDDEHA